MNLIIVLLLAFSASTTPTKVEAAEMTMPIVAVVDGDTIKTTLPLPCPLCNASIRVNGIDTPEKGKKAKCAAEAEKSKMATEFTKFFVSGHKTMIVKNVKWDKYGGRILGDVYVDGRSLSAELIKNGYARAYHGEKKASWCK